MEEVKEGIKFFSGPIWAAQQSRHSRKKLEVEHSQIWATHEIARENWRKVFEISSNFLQSSSRLNCSYVLAMKKHFFSAVVRQKRAVLWNVEREKFSGWKIWIINRRVRCTEMLSKKQRKLFLTVSIFDFSAQLLSFCRKTCASFERKVTAPQESSHIPHFHSYFFAAYIWDILHVFETRSGHGPEPVSCVAAKNV